MSKSENKKSPQTKARKAMKKLMKELGFGGLVEAAPMPEDKLEDILCGCGSIEEAIDLAVKNAKHIDSTDCLNWHLSIMALTEKMIVKGMIASEMAKGHSEQEASQIVIGFVQQIYARASSMYDKHEPTIMEKL